MQTVSRILMCIDCTLWKLYLLAHVLEARMPDTPTGALDLFIFACYYFLELTVILINLTSSMRLSGFVNTCL